MNKATVVLADDEHTLRKNLAKVLTEDGGFEVIPCADGTEALKALRKRSVDALITDLRMPGITGMDLIDHAIEIAPEVVIIVITAFGEVETAVGAMKKGVRDYICKPLIMEDVVFRLKRLLSHDDLVRENQVLRDQARGKHDPSRIVGESASMMAIKRQIERIGNTMSNVLITGESGTGKEVVARAIHYAGPTAEKPFVAVNCGGLAESLVESELFGSRKGSFTGAKRDQIGYFESANRGTLFLDEIGNLPLPGQAALLRAIEERAITRVGENRPRPVDIRIIAATNRELSPARELSHGVETGSFREDLFYRLNVVHLVIPPLRERPEDIHPLANHFLAKYNVELNKNCPGFTDAAEDALVRHAWQGNVRELENAIERALIFADGHLIDANDLGLTDSAGAAATPVTLNLRVATREFETKHIASAVATAGGNKAEAARLLGIGLSSLYRKLDELRFAKASKAGSMQP